MPNIACKLLFFHFLEKRGEGKNPNIVYKLLGQIIRGCFKLPTSLMTPASLVGDDHVVGLQLEQLL